MFSMGGYVAGPVVIAAVLRRMPIVIMEPNAMPGFTNRKVAPFVYRALVGFEETSKMVSARAHGGHRPACRGSVLDIWSPKAEVYLLSLITGGSRGARTLNRAARAKAGRFPRIRHQFVSCTRRERLNIAALPNEFQESRFRRRDCSFIRDMP